jgi:hypothetical protein
MFPPTLSALDDDQKSSQAHMLAIIRPRPCRVDLQKSLRAGPFREVIAAQLPKASSRQGAYCRLDERLEQCFNRSSRTAELEWETYSSGLGMALQCCQGSEYNGK